MRPASGSHPTLGVLASHALFIQLLPNAAGHVFQNSDAPRHHFQLLVLLIHDQLQIGGRELLLTGSPELSTDSSSPWPPTTHTNLLCGLLILNVARSGRYHAGIQQVTG